MANDPLIESVASQYMEHFGLAGAAWFRSGDKGWIQGRGKLPLALLTEALQGGAPIGASPCCNGSVRWLGADLDGLEYESQIRAIPAAIENADLAPRERVLVVLSGSPGSVHVYLILDEMLSLRHGKLCALAFRNALQTVGDVDKIVPTTPGANLRLPGTINHKNGQRDIVLHPGTLTPVINPLRFILDLPATDSQRLFEVAMGGQSELEDPGLLPCVQRFLAEPIQSRGVRNNRMYAIAWNLAQRRYAPAQIEEALMGFFDDCYRAEGGTSRRKHNQEARAIAKTARGVKFNCSEKPEVFRGFCGRERCPFWRNWNRRCDIAGFPANDPRLHVLGSNAVAVYLLHFQAASVAGKRGSSYYFVPAWMEYRGKCAPNTARAARNRLIVAGHLAPVDPREVPPMVLESNGHGTTHPKLIPLYYRWSPLPPLPEVGGVVDVLPESLQADSAPRSSEER